MFDKNLMFADAQSLSGKTSQASENSITIGDYDMSIGNKKPIAVQFNNLSVTAYTASVAVQVCTTSTFGAGTVKTLAKIFADADGKADISNLPHGSKGYVRLLFEKGTAFASDVTVDAGFVDQITGSYHNQ